MAPILSNVTSLQLQMLNQWYSSIDTAIRTANSTFDMVNDILKNGGHASTKLKDSANSSLKSGKRIKIGTAVVTGGIGGIGTEICKRLAADGNLVIATYIAQEKDKALAWKQQFESEGLEVDIHECDVSDFESCKKFATLVENQFGQIEVLVNAAGITRDSMLRKMEPDNWHAVIKTNLDSVFNVTRNFINGMLKNKYGRIINISSVNGQKGQFGQTNYSTAKAGMIGFSRSLALELADKGITVNCVCPGYVKTSMVAAIREDVLDAIIKQIPAGRLASTNEIADAVSFLASKDSSYITGTELAVNGALWLG